MQPIAPQDFLFATWQGGGNLPPVLTVAARLLARGHSVRVASDACDRADVEASGAGFVPWRRAPSRSDRSAASDLMRDWEAASPEEVTARLRDRIMCGPALAYARDLLAELDRRVFGLEDSGLTAPDVADVVEGRVPIVDGAG